MFSAIPWLAGGAGVAGMLLGGWIGWQAGEIRGHSVGNKIGYETARSECTREIERINKEASSRAREAEDAARSVAPVTDAGRVQLCAKDPACRARSERE